MQAITNIIKSKFIRMRYPWWNSRIKSIYAYPHYSSTIPTLAQIQRYGMSNIGFINIITQLANSNVPIDGTFTDWYEHLTSNNALIPFNSKHTYTVGTLFLTKDKSIIDPGIAAIMYCKSGLIVRTIEVSPYIGEIISDELNRNLYSKYDYAVLPEKWLFT